MSECPAFCIVVFIHQQVVVGVEDPLHDIVRCLTWPNKLLPQISPPQLLSLSSVRPWSAVRPVHLGFTFLGFTRASGKHSFQYIHHPKLAFSTALCANVLQKTRKKHKLLVRSTVWTPINQARGSTVGSQRKTWSALI